MYKFTAKEKLTIIKLLKTTDKLILCRRYKVNASTIWRWKKQYDGTLNSLQPQFSRKDVKMPNRQTDEEIKHINDLVKRNPNIGLNELYGKLVQKYNYKRNPVTLYRYLKRNQLIYKNGKIRIPYKPKPYFTPLLIGEKWQVDVKYVPLDCYSGNVVKERYYQYTCIDEATRKRFIYAYKEQSSYSTVDFVLRCFQFYGYKPKTIQTDNGQEFCLINEQTKDGRIHSLDKLCYHFNIEHKRIRPRTPRHNGKVERSHRSDNERFYKFLKYYSFEDLQNQMRAYLKRSNDIPSSVLKSKFDKRRWLSPNEKELELKESM